MPIFRVKSVKIYTGQKNLHWRRRPRRRQLSGMATPTQMGIARWWQSNAWNFHLRELLGLLTGLSARMGKGRSWLGSDQDCLRACTNIQFVKYRQCVHKICMRSKNIQSVKRFSFRIVCLRIHFGKIVTIEQIQNHDNSMIFSTSCV